MSTLHLTLKGKWFDMILSGEKKEEYREIKPYWIKRLSKNYDKIKFVHGYGNDKPWFIIELKGISRGIGNSNWGAPENRVFILSLGEILESGNI